MCLNVVTVDSLTNNNIVLILIKNTKKFYLPIPLIVARKTY